MIGGAPSATCSPGCPANVKTFASLDRRLESGAGVERFYEPPAERSDERRRSLSGCVSKFIEQLFEIVRVVVWRNPASKEHGQRDQPELHDVAALVEARRIVDGSASQ